jgi:hypothetical protein
MALDSSFPVTLRFKQLARGLHGLRELSGLAALLAATAILRISFRPKARIV